MYEMTLLELRIDGVPDSDADELVAQFVASCPIYNTIRRGSGITVDLNGAGWAHRPSSLQVNSADAVDGAAKSAAQAPGRSRPA